MANIRKTLYDIRYLDDLAYSETFVHKLHPLVKLLTTIVYLLIVLSFGKYRIFGLLPYFFYPALIFVMADLPAKPILKRLLIVQPFIIGIGILNPLFDSYTVTIIGITLSRGWITFISICLKSFLTVSAGMLLITTTSMEKIAEALRILKIPKIFVLQLLLTYRYIIVLIEEFSRMMTAYSLKAPGQKGIKRDVWGSFAGQLLFRTLKRAQRVYQAMKMRGFTGEYNTGRITEIKYKDLSYLIIWSLFFVLAKIYNIPLLVGMLFKSILQ